MIDVDSPISEEEIKEINDARNKMSELIQKHLFGLDSKTYDKWTDVSWAFTKYISRRKNSGK